MSDAALPLPPLPLMQRIALRPAPLADMEAEFVDGGRLRHDTICALLPESWSFAGKSVLDFGCGPGRVLRHFVAEAQECTFHGCDIDRESVEWPQPRLEPPFHLFLNKEVPPLPLDGGTLDLIYATSVFTHLTEVWGEWLAELHRLLADDGLLFITFLGCGAFGDKLIQLPWSEDEIGLTMFEILPDAAGGSRVLMSDWWARAHLGRGFEILTSESEGWGALPGRQGRGQGMLLLRRLPGMLTAGKVLAPEPGERREWASAQFNLRLLRQEIIELRATAATSAATSAATKSARRSVVDRMAKLVRRN